MKKVLVLLLTAVLCVSLCACGKTETETTSEETTETQTTSEAENGELTEEQINSMVASELYRRVSNLWNADQLAVEKTRYSIGSITRTADGWDVKGKLTLYDEYGDLYGYGPDDWEHKWFIQIAEPYHGIYFEWD